MSTPSQTQSPSAQRDITEVALDRKELLNRVEQAKRLLEILNSDDAIRGINANVQAMISAIIPLGTNPEIHQGQIRFALAQGINAALELIKQKLGTIDNEDQLINWKVALEGQNASVLNIHTQMRLGSLLATFRAKDMPEQPAPKESPSH